MTGRRSNFRSLALVLVAGCYEKPDIEIAVTRFQAGVPVEIRVCRIDNANDCEGNAVFPGAELERKVFVFADAGPVVAIKLFASTDEDWRECYRVQLADEPLQRTLRVVSPVTASTWGCEPATPCDELEVCPP